MIASRPIILTPVANNNKARFMWQVPIPAKQCSLIGHYTYKRKADARRAAMRALDRIFGAYGDMV